MDKWLWFARFFKTRGLSAKQVNAGHVRVNSTKIAKASFLIGPGDVLTFAQGRQVRVVRLVQLGTRRGPASEAQMLFEDLTEVKDDVPPAPRYEGRGRPSKKDRRILDLDRARTLE